jgi:hypothetical protein
MEWSYAVLTVKNIQVMDLQRHLATMGTDGWELASSLTTVKSIVNLTGNDLVFIFKKPGGGHVAPASVSGTEVEYAGY